MTPIAHVCFIIDDSGSMATMGNATCRAFNQYVETLKAVKGAEVRLSLYTLNRGFKHPYGQWDKHIQDVEPLKCGRVVDGANYVPDGGTDISMAVVNTIASIRAELKKSGPRKVVICIQTDGHEGGNYERQGEARAEVKQALKDGWEFVFMGALVTDAYRAIFTNYAVGVLGIPKENILVYSNNSDSVVRAFSETAKNIGAFASGRAKTAGFETSKG